MRKAKARSISFTEHIFT